MNMKECKEFIKDCLEKYYDASDEMALRMPDVPKEMSSGDVDEEGWVKWKLVKSTITQNDFIVIENEWGTKFPLMLKAYFQVYFHYFEEGVGRVPSDEPFYSLDNAYNPVLLKCGYLPFTWDAEGYFIRCIDLINMPNEDKCAIYEIDHEVLFDYDEKVVTRDDIEGDMVKVTNNLRAYFENVFCIK